MDMHTYDTVSEAVDDLRVRGYRYDFNIHGNHMLCPELGREYAAPQLTIEETHRFEGASDPADEAVVFAIRTSDGVQGVFVDGYGTYYDGAGLELLRQLQPKHG